MRSGRSERCWGRIRPEDMTDAELAAVLAIFNLAEARLPGNKPILRITPVVDEMDWK